jgi:hypothetical protein
LREVIGWLIRVAGGGFGFVGSNGEEAEGETEEDSKENAHVSIRHRAKNSIPREKLDLGRVTERSLAGGGHEAASRWLPRFCDGGSRGCLAERRVPK